MISLPAGTDLKPKMGKGQKDYKTKVRDMFEKLRSFREETNRQISDIINSHSSSISEGIDDLAKEVGDLQSELDVVRNERNVLLQTVNHLNCEIRQLNEKLQVSPENGEDQNQDILTEETKSSSQENQESLIIHDSEEVCGGEDLSDDMENSEANMVDSTQDKVYGLDQEQTDTLGWFTNNTAQPDLVCTECNLPFSSTEHLITHMRNVHIKIEAGEGSQGGTGQSTELSKQTRSDATEVDPPKMTFICGKCFYTTNRKDHLNEHIARVHKNTRNNAGKKINPKTNGMAHRDPERRKAQNLKCARRYRDKLKTESDSLFRGEAMYAKRNRVLKLIRLIRLVSDKWQCQI